MRAGGVHSKPRTRTHAIISGFRSCLSTSAPAAAPPPPEASFNTARMLAADLPTDLVLCVLEGMGECASWYRPLCKASRRALAAKTLRAAHPELPLWLLQQCFQHLVSGSDAPATAKQQAALLSARAAAGDLRGVVWLRSQGCAWNSHACIAAAGAGRVPVLAWLLTAGAPLDANLCAVAAGAAGHVHVLRHMQDEAVLRPFDYESCTEAAAAAGSAAVLHWLASQSASSSAHSLAAATLATHTATTTARENVQLCMTLSRARAPLLAVLA